MSTLSVSRWSTPGWFTPAAVGAGALATCVALAVRDPNQPGSWGACPFRLVTGLDCPGCGTLRAVHALTGGDVVRALDHNVLSMALLPVLVWAWIGWLRHRLGRRAGPPALPAMAGFGIAAAAIGFWIVRNLPFAATAWLGSGAA